LSERDNGILKKSARISFQCSESPKLSFSLSSHFSFLEQYQASALETSNPSQPHHNLEQTLLFFHIILESSVSISSLFLIPFKMHFPFSFIISLISASALEFRDLPSLHMAMPSSTSHVSSESEKDFHGPMPAIGQDPQGSSRELRPRGTADDLALVSSWRSLFAFTTRQHALAIAIAVVSTLTSALFRPTAAILFGKIFSILTKFGAGTATAEDTLHGVAKWCTALVGLGGSAWIVEGTSLSSWMAFGEAQARSIRHKMFEGMLDKEMEWYDLRPDGIGPLLIRIQTYVKILSACSVY
jgi:ATP-binding cassette subfamily B (MDR/TAP) protein 1